MKFCETLSVYLMFDIYTLGLLCLDGGLKITLGISSASLSAKHIIKKKLLFDKPRGASLKDQQLSSHSYGSNSKAVISDKETKIAASIPACESQSVDQKDSCVVLEDFTKRLVLKIPTGIVDPVLKSPSEVKKCVSFKKEAPGADTLSLTVDKDTCLPLNERAQSDKDGVVASGQKPRCKVKKRDGTKSGDHASGNTREVLAMDRGSNLPLNQPDKKAIPDKDGMVASAQKPVCKVKKRDSGDTKILAMDRGSKLPVTQPDEYKMPVLNKYGKVASAQKPISKVKKQNSGDSKILTMDRGSKLPLNQSGEYKKALPDKDGTVAHCAKPQSQMKKQLGSKREGQGDRGGTSTENLAVHKGAGGPSHLSECRKSSSDINSTGLSRMDAQSIMKQLVKQTGSDGDCANTTKISGVVRITDFPTSQTAECMNSPADSGRLERLKIKVSKLDSGSKEGSLYCVTSPVSEGQKRTQPSVNAAKELVSPGQKTVTGTEMSASSDPRCVENLSMKHKCYQRSQSDPRLSKHHQHKYGGVSTAAETGSQPSQHLKTPHRQRHASAAAAESVNRPSQHSKTPHQHRHASAAKPHYKAPSLGAADWAKQSSQRPGILRPQKYAGESVEQQVDSAAVHSTSAVRNEKPKSKVLSLEEYKKRISDAKSTAASLPSPAEVNQSDTNYMNLTFAEQHIYSYSKCSETAGRGSISNVTLKPLSCFGGTHDHASAARQSDTQPKRVRSVDDVCDFQWSGHGILPAAQQQRADAGTSGVEYNSTDSQVQVVSGQLRDSKRQPDYGRNVAETVTKETVPDCLLEAHLYGKTNRLFEMAVNDQPELVSCQLRDSKRQPDYDRNIAETVTKDTMHCSDPLLQHIYGKTERAGATVREMVVDNQPETVIGCDYSLDDNECRTEQDVDESRLSTKHTGDVELPPVVSNCEVTTVLRETDPVNSQAVVEQDEPLQNFIAAVNREEVTFENLFAVKEASDLMSHISLLSQTGGSDGESQFASVSNQVKADLLKGSQNEPLLMQSPSVLVINPESSLAITAEQNISLLSQTCGLDVNGRGKSQFASVHNQDRADGFLLKGSQSEPVLMLSASMSAINPDSGIATETVMPLHNEAVPLMSCKDTSEIQRQILDDINEHNDIALETVPTVKAAVGFQYQTREPNTESAPSLVAVKSENEMGWKGVSPDVVNNQDSTERHDNVLDFLNKTKQLVSEAKSLVGKQDAMTTETVMESADGKHSADVNDRTPEDVDSVPSPRVSLNVTIQSHAEDVTSDILASSTDVHPCGQTRNRSAGFTQHEISGSDMKDPALSIYLILFICHKPHTKVHTVKINDDDELKHCCRVIVLCTCVWALECNSCLLYNV